MRARLLFIIVAIFLFITGCRTISYESTVTYDHPIEIETAGVLTTVNVPATITKKLVMIGFFLDTALTDVDVSTQYGTLKIGNFDSEINEEALKAMIEGAVSAALKTAYPVPLP